MKTEYTISQIAEKLHITTNKIRFYEKKGLLTPMRELQNRYRSQKSFLFIILIDF